MSKAFSGKHTHTVCTLDHGDNNDRDEDDDDNDDDGHDAAKKRFPFKSLESSILRFVGWGRHCGKIRP